MIAIPIEKDLLDGPGPTETLARVSAKMSEPDRAVGALQKVLSTPYESPFAAAVPLTPEPAPARSHVRSAAEGSALPKTRRLGSAKVVCLFSNDAVSPCRAAAAHENSAAFCVTRCITEACPVFKPLFSLGVLVRGVNGRDCRSHFLIQDFHRR